MITHSDARAALERAIRQIQSGPLTEDETRALSQELDGVRKLFKRNEIATQGLVLAEPEYEVLSNLLAASAKHVQTKEPRVFKVLQRVLGRLSQAMQRGEGLRADQVEIHQKRIHEAFAKHDETKLKLAVEDLIASTLRTDADPGLKVARYLMQLVQEILGIQARHGAATLERLDDLLETAVAEWREEAAVPGSDWPTGEVVAQWVVDLVKSGREDLELGQEPWAEGVSIDATVSDT